MREFGASAGNVQLGIAKSARFHLSCVFDHQRMLIAAKIDVGGYIVMDLHVNIDHPGFDAAPLGQLFVLKCVPENPVDRTILA